MRIKIEICECSFHLYSEKKPYRKNAIICFIVCNLLYWFHIKAIHARPSACVAIVSLLLFLRIYFTIQNVFNVMAAFSKLDGTGRMFSLSEGGGEREELDYFLRSWISLPRKLRKVIKLTNRDGWLSQLIMYGSRTLTSVMRNFFVLADLLCLFNERCSCL